jgi:hypothetical protein
MEDRQTNRSFSFWYYSITIILLIFVLFIGGGATVLADMEKSVITISSNPTDPGKDVAFTITGVLTDGKGNILGNKKVTLESISPDNGSGDYAFLAVTTTDINGSYSFFRPEGSPAENLRVKFAGNEKYEGVVSSVVSGHKSVANQKGEIIPTVAKGESKVLIKVSPTTPTLGQSVSIKGQLIGTNGAPLADKKVICESSDRGGIASDFTVLGITKTDKNGFYNFGVGGGSTTSFIRVRFAGDDEYEESISDQVMVL